MQMLIKMFKYLNGKYRPEDEIHGIKNKITAESLKTNQKAEKLIKLLYNRDTTYYLGKAMGVIV